MLLLASMLVCTLSINGKPAETPNPSFAKKVVDQLVDAIALKKITYDTTYIEKPRFYRTIRLRYSGMKSKIKFTDEYKDYNVSSEMTSHLNTTIGLGFNYRGLGINTSFNPQMFSKKDEKDFNLNLNLYTNRFGLEAQFQTTKTYKGDISFDDETYPINAGQINNNSLLLNGYYILNHKHFSFPAAFTQSFIQKRSAGSFMLGASASFCQLKTMHDEKENNYIHVKTSMNQLGIGGGYGYNWVIGKHFMIHLSLVPCVLVINSINTYVNGEATIPKKSFPDFIVTGRNAFVYNQQRFFISFTNTYYQYSFDNFGYYNQHLKYTGRISVGYRF